MPDWSAGEGQIKQHPGPTVYGLGVRPAFSTRKTSLAAETPTRDLTRDSLSGEEGSSVRRRMKSSSECLRYLEATRRKPPFSFQRHHHGNMELEDYVPKREGRRNSSRDAEVQHSYARNQRNYIDSIWSEKIDKWRDDSVLWT